MGKGMVIIMKIVVLAGGLSTERDVSINSASKVCKALREKALGRGKNQEKSLRGFEPNSKWRSMRT